MWKKRHAQGLTKCMVDAVYCIPLSYGKVYIGQTGQCENEKMCEYENSFRGTSSGHLAVHCAGMCWVTGMGHYQRRDENQGHDVTRDMGRVFN